MPNTVRSQVQGLELARQAENLNSSIGSMDADYQPTHDIRRRSVVGNLPIKESMPGSNRRAKRPSATPELVPER